MRLLHFAMKKHNPGDSVEVVFKAKNEKPVQGVIMQRAELLDDGIIVVKLTNGYNVGIDKKKIASIKVLEKFEEKETEREPAGCC